MISSVLKWLIPLILLFATVLVIVPKVNIIPILLKCIKCIKKSNTLPGPFCGCDGLGTDIFIWIISMSGSAI